MIGLQEELIESGNNQLRELKDTVIASVGATIQTELKSCSEAVQASEMWHSSFENRTLLDQNDLKSIVKDVVAEEDRSRNILIFGFVVEPEEKIITKVENVLKVLGGKIKVGSQ